MNARTPFCVSLKNGSVILCLTNLDPSPKPIPGMAVTVEKPSALEIAASSRLIVNEESADCSHICPHQNASPKSDKYFSTSNVNISGSDSYRASS